MAEVQVALQEAEEGEELEVNECHRFGSSVHNQRIERWWDTLQGGQLGQWREMLTDYQERGKFNSYLKWDRIAICYVYIDTLYKYVASFVEVYNTYCI